MVKLAGPTIRELVDLLRQLMEDEKVRHSHLVQALGNDAPVLQHLTWSGSIIAFVPDMVCKLADYGALWTLLEYVRSQVGPESQQRIDKLRPLIDLRSPSSAPTETISGVAAIDIDLLVQQVRSRLHGKIQRLHGTMQLLDIAYPVEIDRLYVDVNILTEPTSYTRLEIDDLLQGRDYRIDFSRFGLAEEGERVAGLNAVENHSKLMVLGKPEGKDRGETILVGSFRANAFGLCDMHGNVWEWCADAWHETYEGAPNDGSAWQEVGDIENQYGLMLIRGGSWDYVPGNCRSASRNSHELDGTIPIIGFRVVCAQA